MLEPAELIKILRARGLPVENIELVSVGSSYFANIYAVKSSNIITDKVFTGFDQNPKVALAKAISEFVERVSFQTGARSGNLCCQTQHSDGFAALPADFLMTRELTCSAVREFALAEATERFVWPTWWDRRTKADISRIEISEMAIKFGPMCLDLVSDLSERLGFKDLYLIKPVVQNSSVPTLIFFLRLKERGFISGGAAGANEQQTAGRGLAELYRHGLAWERVQKFGLEPSTFYERRLVYFSSGKGDVLVDAVLESSKASKTEISLPNLKYDQEVEHQFSDLYVSHRCLFENQPPFVDGELERLCL